MCCGMRNCLIVAPPRPGWPRYPVGLVVEAGMQRGARAMARPGIRPGAQRGPGPPLRGKLGDEGRGVAAPGGSAGAEWPGTAAGAAGPAGAAAGRPGTSAGADRARPARWWQAWRTRFGLAEVCGTAAAMVGFAAGYLQAGSL